MKAITGFISDCIHSVCSVLSHLWKTGIGNIIGKLRYGKAIVDITLCSAWAYSIYAWAGSTFVSILGITLITYLLTCIFLPSTGEIIVELISPFVTIGLYTISALLYWQFAEISLIVALFIIPCVTYEIECRYRKYYRQLSPVADEESKWLYAIR